MADHITINEARGTWVIRAGGAVIGETRRALRLEETGYDPVIYFPREDVAMEFMERSDKTTTCPHKGEASYYSVEAEGETLHDVAWSYETPKDGVAPIAGYLAFDRSVTVEEL